MAKQTFTTGQVLLASQLTSLQETAMGGGAASTKTASYVLVAADAGTTIAMNAAGSTTITVNSGLFAAGDTVFIQNVGAGATTITAGTATVNTAGSLILPQYDAGILYFTSASAAIFYDYIQVGATSPLTTKGDLYTYSTSDTRLGVGANGTVLTADSAQTTGLKWATPASAATAWTLVNTGGTALTGATNVTVNFSAQKELLILVESASTANATPEIAIRPNNISTADYTLFGTYDIFPSTYAIGNFDGYQSYSGDTKILLGANSDAVRGVSGYCYIDKADQTGWKRFQSVGTGDGNTANWHRYNLSGVIEMSAAITSITLNSSSGNFDAGTVYILGAN